MPSPQLSPLPLQPPRAVQYPPRSCLSGSLNAFLASWSNAQKRAYGVADNKLTLNSGWAEELLRIELADLKLQDFDIGLLGFDDTEIERILNARACARKRVPLGHALTVAVIAPPVVYRPR